MSRKILVISASPRRGGKLDVLCDALEAGAREAGKEVAALNINDWNIHPCTGCDACQENEGRCIQEDDMKQVLDALCRAEAVVFATPIYFYNMAGQMKVLLDRTYPLCWSAHFKKAALLAASCEGDESVFDTAVSGFEEYLRCFPDVENAGSVLAGGVCASCALPEKAVEDARMLGREI